MARLSTNGKSQRPSNASAKAPKIDLVTRSPLCVSVDPASEFIDAGRAYAALRAAEGRAWTRPLGEIVDHCASTMNPHSARHSGTIFQYVDLAEVDEVLGAIMSHRELPGRLVGSSKVHFQRGDILFAKIRPSIDNKKVAYVYQALDNAVGSTEFIVLRAKQGIDPLYIYAALRSDEFTEGVIRVCGGDTGRQRISPASLMSMRVPWPDQETRRDIAANVSAYFTSLEATMALRQQALDISGEALGPTTMRTAQPRRKRTKRSH